MTSLRPDRFVRFEQIPWWDQTRLESATVLVVGAGALGNEVVKNLALLGVGHLVVVDMDRIEASNLTRSVLFRASDEGRPKALVAAAAAEALCPGIDAVALVGSVLADVGLGWFRRADVVVGAVDNREARVFVNQACARVGRAWIDGGIDVLNGVVRGFAPPETACYECTMSEADWKVVDERRSCSLLARRARAEGGAPTTPTTASVIGAIQAQEVVKRLHDLDALAGTGFVFEGLGHGSYQVSYPRREACPWHEPAPPVAVAGDLGGDSPFREVWARGRDLLGDEPDAVEFAREIVAELECPSCATREPVFRAIDAVTEPQAVCTACGAERVPHFVHGVTAESPWIDRTVASLGLPAWDVVWARRDERWHGIELAGNGHRRTGPGGDRG